MLRILITLSISLILAPLALAYSDQDASYCSLNAPDGWGIIGTTKTPNQTVLTYLNKTGHGETIVQTTIQKPLGMMGEAVMKELFTGIAAEMKRNGCEAGQLIKNIDTKKPYGEWTSTFQCAAGKTSGTMVFVDGDAKNFYFLIYKSLDFPLTSNKTADQLKTFRSMIQVCYSGKCQSLN